MRRLIGIFLAGLCGCSILGAVVALVFFSGSVGDDLERALYPGLMTAEFTFVAMFFWQLANKIWPNRFFAG